MNTTLKTLPFYISSMKDYFLDNEEICLKDLEFISDEIKKIDKENISEKDTKNIKTFYKLKEKIKIIINSKFTNSHKEYSTNELTILKSYLEIDKIKFKKELTDINNELIVRSIFPDKKTKETRLIERLLRQ